MKVLKTILKILLIIVIIIALLIAGLFAFSKYKNAHYYKFTQTEQPIEKRYTEPGEEKVSFAEFKVDDAAVQKHEIWYPADLEKENALYPVVVIANGSGTPASGYPAFFEHLASWGFIVVGNEDNNSRTGASSEETLEFLLKLNEDGSSIFYGKVDTQNIGIGGHSQGGVGAINAVTSQPHGNKYKALYAVSPTSPYWGQESVFGTEWSYDLSKINIPTFLTAGTGSFDAGTADNITLTEGQGITPLWALQANYAALPDSVEKMIARKKGIDHGDSYLAIDGYMTAWFMWHLQGNAEAAEAFKGSDAEIFHNSLYQDVESNIQ
ncbi:alpha/beta hydrolase family protein [Saccharibacillus sacchari]|uniref:alpha/beta hydrolase family protein n=1 Tax=Saccharibacillus sacchari TaxID=456493 RepID=UPI0004AD9172|nr:hypothetical protein [Saccharibacillus sacchari]